MPLKEVKFEELEGVLNLKIVESNMMIVGSSRIRVLIVEMNKKFRKDLAKRLNQFGYKTFEAENSTDTERIIKQKKIDVVVLGINRFGRGGLSILEMIGEKSPSAKVILLNDSENIFLSIAGMKLGAFDDLLLPVDLEALRKRIEDAYQKKKKEQKAKLSLSRRCQDLMVAATFAEAGDDKTALEILRNKKRRNNR